MKDKFRSALWLIKSVDQRQKTIHKVATSIINFQREFLDHGIEYLRPLVLRDVANDIGMHESTVSRVVNNKYMHTPQGVFELKYFFHSGISSSYGESVSSVTIKQRIRKIIENEDPAQAAQRFEDRQHPAEGRADAGAPHDREVPRGAEDPDLQPEESPLSEQIGVMRVDITGRHVDITPPLRRAHRPGSQEARADPERRARCRPSSSLTKEKYRHLAEIIVHARGDHVLTRRTARATPGRCRCAQADEKIETAGAEAEGASGPTEAPAQRPRRARRAPASERGRAGRAADRPRDALRRQADVGRGCRAAPRERYSETFVVFRNAETDAVSILYRRKDGNLGLIEPD